MNIKLIEALEALCMMWEQYCDGEWGHMCMSAGETCEMVLDEYGLLIPTGGYGNKVDWEKLNELKKNIA